MLLLVGGYAGHRIIWGQPFTLNQLANRQALFFLIRNPELFTRIGAVPLTVLEQLVDEWLDGGGQSLAAASASSSR